MNEPLSKTAAALLPHPLLVTLINDDGTVTADPTARFDGDDDVLVRLYTTMAVIRAIERQAINLTRQGELAVYPSSLGQEASQVGAALALSDADWMFPTYRETAAIVARGIAAADAMPLFKGTWHIGWDPHESRVMPHCTPIATHCLHAVGLAHGASMANDDVVALAFVGDGATSEGDFHEALNFAAVYNAPCVFFVQNNQYAISVPLSKQSKAPTLAHKGVGYGVPGQRVDGNDALAVYAMVRAAVDRARVGNGPTLIEAVTYRMEAHTTADDATRYRSAAELERWGQRDPVARFERFLSSRGVLDATLRDDVEAIASAAAVEFREATVGSSRVDPMELFEHVYVDPPASYVEQKAMLRRELDGNDGGA